MSRIIALVLLSLLAGSTLQAADEREINRAVARRIFHEILTGGDYALAAELYAPDFVNHARNADVSLERDQAAARGWREAFPDLVIAPEIVLAEDDLVAVLWRAAGTNTGSGNGLPATGRRIDGRGITIWRVEKGKVKEEWSEFSELLLMRQLGLVPGGTPVVTSPAPITERPVKAVNRRTRERNRSVVRSVFERIVGKGELALSESLYARTFVKHLVSGGTVTVQEELQATRGLRELAPDLRVSIPLTIADGDSVALVYGMSGTNSGAALGYPATGKSFTVRGMSVMRVDGGRIAEEWSVLDPGQMAGQLGAGVMKNEE